MQPSASGALFPNPKSQRPTLDAVVVPGLLLLVAADLLIRDPSHALSWRLLHGLGTTSAPRWLSWALPRGPSFDRDPLALLVSGVSVLLAAVYLGVAIRGASARARTCVIFLGVTTIVLFPTFLYVSVGIVTGRPFGQDGGVVQLPLAMDLLRSGESPYGADYSDSILGKEARASAFWRSYGENPILHHHAYLPGTHLLTLPFYLGSRALTGGFDARIVSSLALLLAIFAGTRLFEDSTRRLVVAAILGLNPLIYWHQAFGANDMVFVALLLSSVVAGQYRRMGWAGALLGFACATKQLAWPFAPFLLVHWSGVGSFREFARGQTWSRLRRPLYAGLSVFAAVVVPVALLNPGAFWNDIVSYNAGVTGDPYPLGGTPGFGIGNLILYFGGVGSLRDAFPFHIFYLLLAPWGALLVRAQIRRGGLGVALTAGSVSLLAVVYFSRVAHANYLIAVAVFLPIGVLLEGASADVAVTPLALLGLATTIAGGPFFRSAWEAASTAGLPSMGYTLVTALSPRTRQAWTGDPLALGLSGLAGGLALGYAVAAALGASARARSFLVALAIVAVVLIPTALMGGIGTRTGVVIAADEWAVQAPADAAILASGLSPYAANRSHRALGREAWSSSFTLKPPRPLEPRQALFPPGTALLTLALSPLGFVDARAVLVLSLGVLLVVIGRLVAPAQYPLAWTAVGLLPPVAIGVVFGAVQLPWLAVGFLALALAGQGKAAIAGLLAGAATTIDHRAMLVVLFAPLFQLHPNGSQARRFILAAVTSYAALVGSVALLDPGSYVLATERTGDMAPGVGIVNIADYVGIGTTTLFHAVLLLGPWIAGAIALCLLIQLPKAPAAFIGVLWLMMALFFAKEATGFSLAPLLILLVVIATAAAPAPTEAQ